MMLIQTFLPLTLVFLAGWLTPGPNTLAIISASISKGRRNGIMTALGISAGGTLWAALAVFGAVSLFESFPAFALGLKMTGAFYLLWIGLGKLRNALSADETDLRVQQTNASDLQAFRAGFFVIATNPKAALFFGSIVTAFVPVDASFSMLLAIVAFSGLFGVCSHSITASLFGSQFVLDKFNKFARRLDGLFGLLFCGLSLSVAYDALKA
jgi:threonine/homoserine/homoserine lactone efflux protein